MFDELVKIRFLHEKCHEKYWVLQYTTIKKIQNGVFYIFRYSVNSCLIAYDNFLTRNFACFGKHKRRCFGSDVNFRLSFDNVGRIFLRGVFKKLHIQVYMHSSVCNFLV